MLGRLNIRIVTTKYKESLFVNGKLEFWDKFLFFILPYIFAFFLCLFKLPDDSLKNLLGTSLAVFIGLFLNVITILVSQINVKKSNLNFTEQTLRLDILQDTFYTILYALLQSVKAWILLYFMGILTIDNTHLKELYMIIFERNINLDIHIVLTFFLYKLNINIILSFYTIIKNLVALFQKEINIEKLKIRHNQEEKEG